MKHRCVIHERAGQDVDEIVAYIARDSVEAVANFYDAFMQGCERLREFPWIGPAYGFTDPLWVDVRYWPVGHYRNYLIFYRPTSLGVEILRVLHGARDISTLG